MQNNCLNYQKCFYIHGLNTEWNSLIVNVVILASINEFKIAMQPLFEKFMRLDICQQRLSAPVPKIASIHQSVGWIL